MSSEDVDTLFENMGAFGKYQKLVFLAACLITFASAPTIVQDPFTTYEENFRFDFIQFERPVS